MRNRAKILILSYEVMSSTYEHRAYESVDDMIASLWLYLEFKEKG